MALNNETIDAASFTGIRLFSGVITLAVLVALRKQSTNSSTSTKGSWSTSLYLFVYAIAFSYAYITLETGMGALILFGAVQITMITVSIVSGKALRRLEWIGVLLAFSGFVYLVLPTLSTPSLVGVVLMSISGAAWGLYTVAGRGALDPLRDTSINFLRTIPFLGLTFLVSLLFTELKLAVSAEGVIYAVLSGAIASGIGYTLWYIALRGLSAVRAGVVQLFVPVLAALFGVVFADEFLTTRLIIAAGIILGGILLVLTAHQNPFSKLNRPRSD